MDAVTATLQAIVLRAADLFLQLTPYVLIGTLAGAWLRGLRPHRGLERISEWRRTLLIPLTAAVGTVSPLCTFGTVPVLRGLMGRGFPAPAALAFLVSSSMANPQVLILTVGAVGPGLAAGCWIAAWVTGVLAGIAAGWAVRRGQPVLLTAPAPPGASSNPFHPAPAAHRPGAARPFRVRFLDDLEYMGLYLVPGVILAAAFGVLTPERALVRWLGPENAFAVVVSTIASVPLYVCGGGVLPMMAQLQDAGVSGGVVLAFLIAGPATRIQALAAVKAVLTWRALAAYVLLVMGVAVLAGTLARALP